ncbi:MAG: FHA domain-containing protein [Chloroflexota bacterium]
MKLLKLSYFFSLILLFAWVPSSLVAQDDDLPDVPVAKLTITDTNVEAIPTVGLRLYGRDEQGNPIDFSQRTLSIQSNGAPVGPVSIQGQEDVGTLTIFLIDIPTGVTNQLTAVQNAIQAYASPVGMQEQVDYVAVFQVGASEPTQLLEPVPFHNSVRNLFVTPLIPETGATALLDSTFELLNQIEGLKPTEGMAASIVLLTDGTDSVSTRNEPEDVARLAAELGIPVHTLWLLNDDLGDFSRGAGQEYLAELSAESGGIAAFVSNDEDWPLIWNRIAGFRSQTRVLYTASALTPGDATISVSLADDPSLVAETAVSIPDNIPSIVVNLSADARTMSLPNLDRPVNLQFNTTLQWLDGVERTLDAAQFVVNGDTVADIPVNNIAQFSTSVSTLQYGNNAIEIVILDDQGILARSPELILTVNEGPRTIPPELSAGLGGGSTLRTVLISVVLLGIAAAVWFFAWRNGWLKQLTRLLPQGRRRTATSREPQVVISDEHVSYSVTTQPMAHLEVVTTKSTVDKSFALRDLTVRIGRSPSQSDIAFDKDITVSRVHATLRLEGSHYRIYDEQSTSGTWVNDRQVPDYGTQLQDGDEIHLGEVVLLFKQGRE